MATKTFKIGEYCIGGIIKVTINKNKTNVQVLDWDSKKEINNIEVSMNDIDANDKLNDFLWDVTTSYYTDMVLNWINNNQ
jgi:hypothetical protein